MAILGAHMSIAGGYFKAAEAAHREGCQCVQLFTKNNNQWQGKPITPDDIEAFRTAMATLGITHPLSHASYLINLGSPDNSLWRKSIEAMAVELERAHQLGIPHVVLHPGSPVSESESFGMRRIAEGLQAVLCQTAELPVRILLETTAGQGAQLGFRFEQLAELLEQRGAAERLGVCLDTCHMFAAGYPLSPQPAYEATMGALENSVGLRQVYAIHVNDSLKGLGSRRDRHAHIGQGEMGIEPFRLLLTDARWTQIPMYLETPKGPSDEQDLSWDQVNLRTLRGLASAVPLDQRTDAASADRKTPRGKADGAARSRERGAKRATARPSSPRRKRTSS